MFTKKPDFEFKKIDSVADRLRLTTAGFPALSKIVKENGQLLRSKDYGMFGVYSNKERKYLSVIVTARSIILINSMHILLYEVRSGYPVQENLKTLFDFFIEQSESACITAGMSHAVSQYKQLFLNYGMRAYEITVDGNDIGISEAERGGGMQTTILVRTSGSYEKVSPLPSRVSPTFPRIREFVEVDNRPKSMVLRSTPIGVAECMA